MSFRIPNTRVAGLALLCWFSSAFAKSPESIFYDHNYHVSRGNIEQIDSKGTLHVRQEADLSTLGLDEIEAILAPADTADFMKLLTQTNYKTMNRQGFQIQSGIPYAFACQDALKPFWQAVHGLFKENNRLSLVIGYRILADGTISGARPLQSSGKPSLDEAAIEKLQTLRLPALPAAYNGTWIPAYTVLSLEEVEKKRFLLNMRETLSRDIPPDAVSTDCTYRIRLLYKPDGTLLFHEILGSRQSTQRVESCHLSDHSRLVSYFKTQKPSVFPWEQNEFWGLSVWLFSQSNHTNRVWVSIDPSFVDHRTKVVVDDYAYKQFEPAMDKLLRQKTHKQKLKIDWRASRYARFFITFSPGSWPSLKNVVMTTPSGDPAFDQICLETLHDIKLQKLPELMNVADQRTSYKCGLWGED